MSSSQTKIKLVYPPENPGATGLAQVLTEAYPEVSENSDRILGSDLGGCIFLESKPSGENFPGPSLTVTSSARLHENVDLKFGTSVSVPPVFRNRTVKQSGAVSLEPAVIPDGAETLLSLDGQPIWVRATGGPVRRDFCSLSLEPFKTPKLFFNYLAGDTFAQILPIIDFIRHVTREDRWTAPGLRANIMFDDPNLHSVRYGHLDYAALVKSATGHRYTTSFATIPLDAWFTQKKSAELFKAHPRQISLLVHGNNHLSNELASFGSSEIAIREMSQAFNRIRALEKSSGVEVSKIVAAPHGACSELTLEVLGRLGYEGACISSGSLNHHNQGKPWTRNIGTAITEMVQGTPVMPRFRVAYSSFNSILLAAYLNQPIVPVGHHEDAADGLKMVEAVADFINSLGKVAWGDMKDLCRSNFLTATDGSTLKIKLFTRLCEVQIPQGVTSISLDRPWLSEASPEVICLAAAGQSEIRLPTYTGELLPVTPSSTVRIASLHPAAIDPATVKGGVNIWAFARRQLCECRDRLKTRGG